MATIETAPAARAERAATQWSARTAQALLLQALLYVLPIGGSLAFTQVAMSLVPPPQSSIPLFVGWWIAVTVASTGILVGLERVARRVLPLTALLKLSLVFPDAAPSRFKVAFRSGSVERLQECLASFDVHNVSASEAASRLLELVALLNIHDPLTRGHCDRVRAYSVMIGDELGLTREEIDRLNWAALLHDVGKLEVPTSILAKPGKPTDEEWEVLRQHPAFGESLVGPMRNWLGTWIESVGYHHERWDGKGYPRGLAGEDIPLPGRIVAVADVFDVITSVRSYKKAFAAIEARAEIARCAGTQFDPAVVRAFLNVSLGRMRLVMGPLSLLSHLPLLGRLPLTPAVGTLAGAFTVAATSAVGGVAATPLFHQHQTAVRRLAIVQPSAPVKTHPTRVHRAEAPTLAVAPPLAQPARHRSSPAKPALPTPGSTPRLRRRRRRPPHRL